MAGLVTMKRANVIKSKTFISRILLLYLVFLVLIIDVSSAQSSNGTIEGVLIDQATNEPIPSANIYLSNTTHGAPSNPDGTFQINNIPPGNYDLIVQFVGFKPIRIPIAIDEGERIDVGRIELRQQQLELGQLEVTSSRPRQWRRELRRFEKAFIGSSFNSRKTTIENPEVLSFTRDEENNRLIAEASRDLHVINKSLGYELFISLIKFSWDTELGIGSYMFTSRFVEMEPEDRIQAREWRSNRRTTYTGSFQHFLVNLQQGFADSKFEILNGTISEVVRDRDNAILLNTTAETKYSAYRMIPAGDKNPLVVRYDGVVSTELYGKDNNLIVLDRFGNLVNPENIIMAGYWFDYRMGDLLPLDYQ